MRLQRVGRARAQAPRPAVVLAFVNCVEFLWRLVVTAHVRAVVKAIQLPCFRLPTKTHGVAQAAREHFTFGAIRSHAQHGGVFGVGVFAVVAGGAYAHVEPPIRPHAQRTPRVVATFGQVVKQQSRGCQGAIGLHLCNVEAGVGDDVQIAVVQQQAVRAGNARHCLSHISHALAMGVAQQQHVALAALAGIHIALGRYLQPAHIAQALRKYRCGKPVGKLETAKAFFGQGYGCRLQDANHRFGCRRTAGGHGLSDGWGRRQHHNDGDKRRNKAGEGSYQCLHGAGARWSG